MSVKITTVVSFNGTEEELEQLVADLGEVIVDWGYGNNTESYSDLKSLILLENFDLETEEDYELWLEEQINKGAFIALPVGEENERKNSED